MEQYDRIIIGAGLYGLYSALFCGKAGMKVLVLEKESAPFTRATYINQARVHMGYHYPRSLATAVKSAGYFSRFCKDYDFCIHRSFDQVYATSREYSWTNADQFMEFCRAARIKCEEVSPARYFHANVCDGAFLTEEYTYDAILLRDHFLEELAKYPNVEIRYQAKIRDIARDGDVIRIGMEDGRELETGFLLNATYASVNEILQKIFPQETFGLKYELCEIILCEVGEQLKDTGITVMDGPFFSIMPFGKTGLHSLTSVTFTPHAVSYEPTARFACQKRAEEQGYHCSPESLGNCDLCPAHPQSAWEYMSHLARKYMKPEYEFTYKSSLFSMKPILVSSEVDDSRPTAIRRHLPKEGEKGPVFISVLSGKINTVYDLDEYLV